MEAYHICHTYSYDYGSSDQYSQEERERIEESVGAAESERWNMEKTEK